MSLSPKFLIVDDSEIDRIINSRLLMVRMGAKEIFFAENGQKAIDVIQSHRHQFGPSLIILLDLEMPVMNGLQFLEAFEKMDLSLKSITQFFYYLPPSTPKI